MTRRLRLTTCALRDLDEIFDFLAEDDPTAALRYVTALRDHCDIYLANPLIGQREADIAERLGGSAENVRSFLYRNHRCYYLVMEEEMRVLGFMDMRRDPDRRWDELLGRYEQGEKS